MSQVPVIAAFDPSVDCTGWCLLHADGSPLGRILEKGTHCPHPLQSLPFKIQETHSDVLILLRSIKRPQVLAGVVIEYPARRRRAPSAAWRNRSTLTLPNYGVVVGAVHAAVLQHAAVAKKHFPVLTPGSDEWTGGDIPSSEGDEHKTKRVRYVEALYGLPAGALGVMSKAGNVADAVLLARHGLNRIPIPNPKETTCSRRPLSPSR